MNESIKKGIKQVEDFFVEAISEFKIKLLETREEMDKVCGRKTEDWVVGHTNNNTIYIFSEEVFEEVSCHSKEDFFKILVHEITHAYTNKKFGLNFPMWLNEGISLVIAGQDKKIEEKEDIQ